MAILIVVMVMVVIVMMVVIAWWWFYHSGRKGKSDWMSLFFSLERWQARFLRRPTFERHLSWSILPIIVSTSEYAKNRRRFQKCATWIVLSNFAAIVRTHLTIYDFFFLSQTLLSVAVISIEKVFIFFPRRFCPKIYCDLFILPT